VPLGRIRARPSCTVALGPRSRRRVSPRPRGARPMCAVRGLRLPGMGEEEIAHRSSSSTVRGENRLGGSIFLMRWGYGGLWQSYDGEERGGGELDAPRMKMARGGSATLTVGVLVTAEAVGQRRSWHSDSDGQLQIGRWHGRDERCRDGWREAVRTAVAAREARRASGCRVADERAAVRSTFNPPCACPDSAAHGSQSGHGAARHCR
jgi:hypothetical protein